ncbi:MAG: hypothetical protein V1928_05655 [Parcubacteria group bacterium]
MTINDIIKQEQESINLFFNTEKIIVPPLPEWITEKHVERWQSLFFDLHFLPRVEMKEDLNLEKWKDRPEKVFYDKVEDRKITAAAVFLPGKWVLVDSRNKPERKRLWINKNEAKLLRIFGVDFKKSEKQQYDNDYLKEILHNEGFGSRFCLNINDIDKLKPFAADILQVKNGIVRLPRFIEWNYMANAFYPQWATTKTWEWFEDKYGNDCHLAGGHLSSGVIGWDPENYWSTILGFRFIVEM